MIAAALAVVLLFPASPKTPVPIFTRIDTEMFPESWVAGEPKASATSLPDSEKDRSLRVVAYGLAKYPEDFLKANLKKVYVVATLEFYGLPYGGTNSSDTVYLSNRGVRNGYTDLYLEESFHHEFSSILLRNERRSFNRRAWVACNDPEITYQGDGTQALRDGTADTKYRDEWHEKGFLAEYATASIEEDFNMMVEGLFSGDARFWRAVDKFPRIKAKADQTIAFYHKLNESFTEQKFRAMQPVD
jgi:hypothetical protein